MKILTISVAAYNVAPYIENALRSLCIPEIIDDIEVFVVDDGGTDDTLKIAKEYEKKYPFSFHVVHKENGGYGSTVNYSIKHATGKYFKLLDGDDWYDSGELVKLIKMLKKTNSDIVVTNYKTGPDKSGLKIIDYYSYEKPGVKSLSGFIPVRYFGMWAMVVKTKVLRDCKLTLPEHELYTDQYFCTYPLAYAKTIQFVNCSVYCYRTERDGQSMSKESRIKHYKTTLDHAIKLTRFCASQKGKPNYPIILKRVGGYHSGAINTLLLKPISKKSLNEIKMHERKIKTISKDVFNEAVKAGETGRLLWIMRHTGYLSYWLIMPVLKRLISRM